MNVSTSPGRGGVETLGPAAETPLILDHDVSSSPGPTPLRPSGASCQLPDFYKALSAPAVNKNDRFKFTILSRLFQSGS